MESNSAPTPKVEFANQLRGIAALCVLLAHYVGVFPYLQGEIGGFPKTPEPILVGLYDVITLGVPNLNWGPFGVALFFLVSGFVISFSVDRIAGLSDAFRFFCARYVRLWPVYVVGLAISAACFWFSFRYTGLPYPWTLKNLLIISSFFRDWVGALQLDGVVWTLEVEMKFYLLAVLFSYWTRRGVLVLPVAVALLAAAGWMFKVSFPVDWNPPSNFLYSAKYVLFICIGTLFYLNYKSVLMSYRFGFSVFALFAVFAVVAGGELRLNYGAAVLVFCIFYAYRHSIQRGKIFGFLADISFPLYAIHSVFGMLGMRVMINVGLAPWQALSVQIPVTLGVAWLVHQIIERPSHRLAKAIW